MIKPLLSPSKLLLLMMLLHIKKTFFFHAYKKRASFFAILSQEISLNELTIKAIPINKVKCIQKQLWHQRLGHPCDKDLYSAHKCIKGVPKFKK